MKVYVDGNQLPASEFSVSKNEVHFTSVPKAAANLRFVFLYEAAEKNLRLEPMLFAGGVTSNNTQVFLNGKLARPEDTIFEKDLDGNSSLRISEAALSANDPYDIRQNQGLSIKVIAAQ
jgi:hypothetical protein